jgi:hypothetical protein
MRRKISIIGLLLLSLCVSGWSSALAAALFSCSHAKSEEPRAPVMEQDHSCCRAKLAKAESHCSTAERKPTGGMRMMPSVVDARAEATAQAAGSCAHCIDRSEVPATPIFRQANRINRNADAVASRKVTPVALFTTLFTPQVTFRQGSPPGHQARKHLLISVFII